MREPLHSLTMAFSAVLLLPALLAAPASCVTPVCPMEGTAVVVAMDGHDCCPRPGAALEAPCCLESPAALAVQAVSPEKPKPLALQVPQLPVPPAMAARDRASALFPPPFSRLDCLSQSCVLRI